MTPISLRSDMPIRVANYLSPPKVRVNLIPRVLFSDHSETVAQRNHRQSLEQLRLCGGVVAEEAIAILAGCSWKTLEDLPEEVAHRILYEMVVLFRRGKLVGSGRLME